MIEWFVYHLMQLIGYRKYYYDWAFIRGIPLDSYEEWRFLPNAKKGTYRETNVGFEFVGYGVDK